MPSSPCSKLMCVCLHTHTHTHTHSGQPCPPFKIIVLDEADSMTTSAQVSKTKHSLARERRRRCCVCLCCRLPYVVQWRRNREQLVSASYATTSAGQTKPLCVVMVIPFLHSGHMSLTHFLNANEENSLIRTLCWSQGVQIERGLFHCCVHCRIIEPLTSRCSKFRFKPLAHDILTTRLEHIAQQENVSCQPVVRNSCVVAMMTHALMWTLSYRFLKGL